MPHEDGSLYFPTVSTISLGSHTLLDFYKPIDEMDNRDSTETNGSSTVSFDERYMFSLLLEPRSLLILRDDMYKVYLHGIKEATEDFLNRNLIFNFDELGDKENYSELSTKKRSTRISLTIRYVSKLLKVNLNSVLFNKK
jgi:alkylated DNA repair protein alkB family protein 6